MSTPKLEVQTRNEEGALEFFSTLKEAVDHADQNPDVWKISFGLPTEERVRLVRNEEGKFVYEDIMREVDKLMVARGNQ